MATNDTQKTKSAPLIEPQDSPKTPTLREHEYRGVIWTIAIILVLLVVAALAYQAFMTGAPKQTSSNQAGHPPANAQQLSADQQAFDAAQAKSSKPLTAAQGQRLETEFNAPATSRPLTAAEAKEIDGYMQAQSQSK